MGRAWSTMVVAFCVATVSASALNDRASTVYDGPNYLFIALFMLEGGGWFSQQALGTSAIPRIPY